MKTLFENTMYRKDPSYRSSENFREAELISRQEEKKVLRSKEYMKRRNEAQKLLAMLNESDGETAKKRSDAANMLAIMDKESNQKNNSPVPLKAITNGNRPQVLSEFTSERESLMRHVYRSLVSLFQSPPGTPLNALQATSTDKTTAHRFLIQNGKTKTDLQEYLSFKQYYCLRWGK